MAIKNIFRKKSVTQILKQAASGETDGENHSLSKHLGVKDLTAFGIAAIIGAGIFSTIGNASAAGGPAVVFLFIFTAIACGFSAFAYAEFASMVPVSGSAYTYSYVAFGEIIAWLIGWSLIMEYAIGNIAVAISWSDYFTGLLSIIHIESLGINGIHVPAWASMDYLSASKAFKEASVLITSGKPLNELSFSLREGYNAWQSAPSIFGLRIIADLPALFIIVIITRLVYKGIKESKNASNLMVIVKLCIILLIIAVGAFYVDVNNWSPFAPNGISGVLKGISAVFFAYIGFDAISTTAEECKDPQRDLPRGMMWSIIICTILYVIIALILTGMVKYNELGVGDPLAFVFQKVNLQWISGIIAVSAVVAMASVLLVFQLGQPRIWMSMSRDGLLPKAFSKIHPKFKTPSTATIVTGFVVAIPALFLNLTAVTDLCSIGTLFAFVLVCGGVLKMQNDKTLPERKFKTPYLNSKYIAPVLLLVGFTLSFTINKENTFAFLSSKEIKNAESFVGSLDESEKNIVMQHVVKTEPLRTDIFASPNQLLAYFTDMSESNYEDVIKKLPIDEAKKYNSGWNVFKHNIPFWVFILSSIAITFWCFKQNLSLIPVLGLTSCLYMMSEMGLSNWIGFSIWLLVGVGIYFAYGIKNSKLAKEQVTQ
ncbi:MAG: amino acid permease [Bacteroidota bacterium]